MKTTKRNETEKKRMNKKKNKREKCECVFGVRRGPCSARITFYIVTRYIQAHKRRARAIHTIRAEAQHHTLIQARRRTRFSHIETENTIETISVQTFHSSESRCMYDRFVDCVFLYFIILISVEFLFLFFVRFFTTFLCKQLKHLNST